MTSPTPIVSAFLALGLEASDTPAGPLVGCPRCGANTQVKAKALLCGKCDWAAVGDPWQVAQLAKAALPPPAKAPEEFPFALEDGTTMEDLPPLPESLVDGILAKGNKMVLGGGSKSNKSWSLIHLALALATGTDWWGHRVPKKRKVLYINLEIQREYFIHRVAKVAAAAGMELEEGQLKILHLRGHCDDHSRLLPLISRYLEEIGETDWDVIIIDPIYKMLHGSESDQQFMSALVDNIERFGATHGAATVYGAHFAKGDAWQKSVMDRIAGSGVVARDADTILCVTKLPENEDLFALDVIPRNFARVESKGLRWVFPLMKPEPLPAWQPDAKAGHSGRRPDRAQPATTIVAALQVPGPAVVAEVLARAGGEASSNKDRHDSLVALLVRQWPSLGWKKAQDAIEAAIGVTIQYTGDRTKRKSYVLKNP